ncbi:MAG: DUF927 domain-containing protein [Candidatus Melainabacteria bacterium]|nr:DUF927 domain-containing protein [Candidatus Melainabacteria bacterium]
MPIFIKNISKEALRQAEYIVGHLLPNGKRQGNEYLSINPTRSDAAVGSFSVNLRSGKWGDFATHDRGGDLVSLTAYLHNYTQLQAAHTLATLLGLSSVYGLTESQTVTTSLSAEARSRDWHPLLPIPHEAPPPPDAHPTLGKPSACWIYRDQQGAQLLLQCRFETQDGKKFSPLTFCENAGKRGWRWKAPPEPRPLFHLDKLTSAPNAVVLFVEGEKAADAAAVLFPDHIVTTSLNGALSPHKSDFSPLAGRKVLIWPDNDQAGQKYATSVATLASQAGAAEVRIINVELLGREAGLMLSTGFDAADAVIAGWTTGFVQELLQKPGVLIELTPFKERKTAVAQGFTVTEDGVFALTAGDEGEPPKRVWICSPLQVVASTRDKDGNNWGRLLAFSDPDGTKHQWSMPMELLKGSGEDCRATLLNQGLQIAPSTWARNQLGIYLQSTQPQARALCVQSTGWHQKCFVLPNRTLGESDEKVLYQSPDITPNVIRPAGTFDEWQMGVSRYCRNNSRLIFCLSTAFAASLLHITGEECGGFNLKGPSSVGKTTLLHVSGSLWGPHDFVRSWRTTSNGLEGIAAMHNDLVLPLDDLAQLDPQEAGLCAYMLGNGHGKGRATKAGGAKRAATWRLLFLSSGELGLSDHVRVAGRRTTAGQEIRLIDIPADAGSGLGVFEHLHGYASGDAFARALKDTTSRYYGTAGPGFVGVVDRNIESIPERVRTLRTEFMGYIPAGASGQVTRVGGRFALISAAGELATAFGITGWKAGEATQSAVVCFKAWLQARGDVGALEPTQMLSQVRQYLELHGEARFVPLNRIGERDDVRIIINRAGFRRTTTTGESEFLIFPEAFRNEVCKGFDPREVSRLLVQRDFLVCGDDGKKQRLERLPELGPKRVYVISSKILGD